MLFLIWLVALTSAIVLLLKHVYSHFRKRGVNHLPTVPLFGNMLRTTMRLEHFLHTLDKEYHEFPEDRFIGHFEFTNPVVILKDLELIKQVNVKEYEYFLDHRVTINDDVDPFFGRNLFSLKGNTWRDMRTTLSPAFTGSKMRAMVPLMVECGKEMVQTLKAKMKSENKESLELEAKDLATRYANDVIASCAFGLKVNSLSDEENEFYKMGKFAANFTFVQMLKFFGFSAFPAIMNKLKVKMFSEDVGDFFRNLVLGTMKDREEHNIVRPDMIQLLMEAKKGTLTHEKDVTDDAGFATVEESNMGKRSTTVWSDEDLIAQAVLFFIAGFDTVATAMAFGLYELAHNLDVQNKLYQEIKHTEKMNNGKFDYNSIQKMKYMDMVISEVIRLWPPAVGTDRICTKPFNLGKPNAKATEDYIVQKGQGIFNPIWSIHRDPNYFPDPEKFDPERFSDENKSNIKPFTYMPFGNGPRNCIGSRFALSEVKIMLYHLLKDIEVSPSPRTTYPPTLLTNTFNLRIGGGHWLKFSLRN